MLAAVSLGSNLSSPCGPPAATLAEAIRRLGELGTVIAVSTLRLTDPVDLLDQPSFLNAAVLLDTSLSAPDLLHALLAIERALGRVRDGVASKGPRSIDLDLLLHDGAVTSTAELTVPHPRMHERRFVLEPLAEIAPTLLHPVFNTTISDLLARLDDRRHAHTSVTTI